VTPLEQGYSMPAEWERHDATWLAWPKNPLTFPPEMVEKVERVYVQMIEALSPAESVHLLVDDEKTEEKVRSMVSPGNLVFHLVPTADVWLRDYGPIFVKREGRVAATKWRFNAWGSKYDDLLPDDEAGRAVARLTGLDVFETGVVLEGGSIEVNGKGMLITTTQCLLNRNRNPALDRRKLERLLLDNLGAHHVLWLGRGISGDDTDGHVDDVARFVDERTVVCMVENDTHKENHKPLKENLELLSKWKGPDGGKLTVVPVEMPDEVEGDGPLPASYANFYIGNSAVLLPVFDSRKDDKAIEAISGLFKGRKVVPIDCRELVYGFGAIHCVTQHQPSP